MNKVQRSTPAEPTPRPFYAGDLFVGGGSVCYILNYTPATKYTLTDLRNGLHVYAERPTAQEVGARAVQDGFVRLTPGQTVTLTVEN